MYRLFYVSTASPDFEQSEIPLLADKATSKNARLGVTGVLKFNGVNFAQVLEGPRDDVEALMEVIRRDHRHTGVIVISQMEVAERLFSNWSVSFVDGLDFHDFVEAMRGRSLAQAGDFGGKE